MEAVNSVNKATTLDFASHRIKVAPAVRMDGLTANTGIHAHVMHMAKVTPTGNGQ